MIRIVAAAFAVLGTLSALLGQREYEVSSEIGTRGLALLIGGFVILAAAVGLTFCGAT